MTEAEQPQRTEEEERLAAKGLAVIKSTTDLETLQTRLIESRLTSEEAAEAYLYVIMPTPENRLPKPIVGPTLDFKKLIVQMLNASGQAKLTMMKDRPPIVEDVAYDEVLDGGRTRRRHLVRAMVCVIDELTGLVKWAVKEEARRSPHAATIAVEKAEGKAYESHPVFNRKLVTAQIKKWLKRAKLDPKQFTIGGSTGPWSDFFARASKAGTKPDDLRAKVKEKAGVGFSEIESAAQVQAAAAAVDESSSTTGPEPTPTRPPAGPEGEPGSREEPGREALEHNATGDPAAASAAPTPAPTQPSPPARKRPAEFDETVDIAQLRDKTLHVLNQVGVGEEVIRQMWRELGPVAEEQARLIHYQRMHRAAEFMSVGAPLEEALKMAKTLHKEPVDAKATP